MELNSTENSNISCELIEQYEDKINSSEPEVDLDNSINTRLKLSTIAAAAEDSKISVSECDSMNKDEIVGVAGELSGISVDLESSNAADRLELLSTSDSISGIASENILNDRSNVSGLEFDMGSSDLLEHSDLCLGSNPLDSVPVTDSLKEAFHDEALDKEQSIGMTFSDNFISDNETKNRDSTLNTCIARNNIPVSLPTIHLLPLECQNLQILTPVSNAVVRSLHLPSDTNQTVLQGTPPAQGTVLSSALFVGNMVMLTQGSNTAQNSLMSNITGMPNKTIGSGNLLLKTPIKLQLVSAKQQLLAPCSTPTTLTSIPITELESSPASNTVFSPMTVVSNPDNSEQFDVSVGEKKLDVKCNSVTSCSATISKAVCSDSSLQMTDDSNFNDIETTTSLLDDELDSSTKRSELTAESNMSLSVSSDLIISEEQQKTSSDFVAAPKDDGQKEALESPISSDSVEVSNKLCASKVKKLESKSQSKSPNKEKYNCDLCSAVFSRLGNFTRHRMTHTVSAKDDYRYKCDECGRLFLQRCDMRRHMLIHSKQEPYHCQDCGKGYIRKSDLVVHMRFHKKDRPFKCESCSKSFYQSGDLNRHMRNVHLHTSTVMCGHCNRSYAKEATLIRHMQTTHRTIILQSLNINSEQTTS